MQASPERDNDTATFDPAWDIGEEAEKVRIVPTTRRQGRHYNSPTGAGRESYG